MWWAHSMFWTSMASRRLQAGLCILLFLFAPSSGNAQETGLRAQLAGDVIAEAEPGKTITWTFLVSNASSNSQEVHEELTLPAGWRRISPAALSFSLPPNGSEVRII